MCCEKLVLLIIAFSLSTCESAQESRTPAYNGQIITIDQAPYLVQMMVISLKGWLYCLGTLVTPQHVVTAAHCFDHVPAEDVLVVGGATTTYENGVQRRVVSLRRSKSYSPQTLHMDVAVLKLDRPMWGSNIKRLPLCTQAWTPGSSMQVSGWEKTNLTFPGAEQLRTFSLPMITHKGCILKHGSTDITNTMECVRAADTEGCSIISGSPGVHKGQLCALFSWTRGCKEHDYPGVYTNVYNVHDFIERAIRR